MHNVSMNRLPTEKRVQILSMLCEGSSMRSVSRVADVSLNTVDKLLRDAGEACAAFHDEHVPPMPGLDSHPCLIYLSWTANVTLASLCGRLGWAQCARWDTRGKA
jgi:hypothetical protein